MPNAWINEAWRAAAVVVMAVVVGLLIGQVTLLLLLVTLVYLAWHVRNVVLLEQFLRDGKRFHPPEAWGVWGEVYHSIYRLQQRNRQRKRRITRILGRFRESTAAMPDATAVLGPQGEIEWWNDAATRLLGLRHPHDIGQRIGNLVRHPRFTEYLRGNDYTQSVIFPSPGDETVMLSVNLVPYGKSQALLVARDYTLVHRLEQVRRDFVANVSHELRTPLTVIHGFLETLADADDVAMRPWQRSLHLMQQQSLRMQLIVEDLLLLSRLETDRDMPQDTVVIAELLAAIHTEAVALSGEHGHHIELHADAALNLRGNGSELRSAFTNLAVNAVRYTPAGGHIVLRWEAEGQGGARFSVQDTGPGIAPHHLPRLTERFYRVDTDRSRAHGGTGLGLAIVKHVLSRHHAKLLINSELGKGSTFSCAFPSEAVLRVRSPVLDSTHA